MVDRSRYEIVRTLPRLQEWIARAYETGMIAIDVQTSSIDPMQATLCGFSLALTPNEACYVPLAHRQGGDGSGGLFAGEVAPDQISETAALGALKPLLEDQSILKVGQDCKHDWTIFAQRGIEVAPYDDTMLISYVLDAGRSGHDLEALATRYFDHAAIDHAALIGSGKSRITFDCVAVDKAAEYAAERADLMLRLWHVLKPRLTAERVNTVYQTLERPLAPGCWRAWSGAAFPSIGRRCRASRRIRAAGGARGRGPRTCRRAGFQSRQPETARRHPVRQDGAAGRHQDQDRPMGHRRARAR